MHIRLLFILTVVSIALAGNAVAQVWYSKNSVDPVTDERKGLAGVRSIQQINYDHPILFYICDESSERLQIKTNEIHDVTSSKFEEGRFGGKKIGNFVWFRVDDAELVEQPVSLAGDYNNSPTATKDPYGDPVFDELVQSLRRATKTIAIKTQQVTFTTRVTGSDSKIGAARRFCGLE